MYLSNFVSDIICFFILHVIKFVYIQYLEQKKKDTEKKTAKKYKHIHIDLIFIICNVSELVWQRTLDRKCVIFYVTNLYVS